MIAFDLVVRDDEDDPDGNVQHIADHGLTVDDVEAALYDPDNRPIVRHGSYTACPCIPLGIQSPRTIRRTIDAQGEGDQGGDDRPG